ncbi:MAG: hemolysin III family protein [Candidatus Bipolaricaulia bacterium]
MESDQTSSGPVSYGVNEEAVNSATHGLGVLVSIAGLIMLLLDAARTSSLWMLTSFSIYGASLIVLFLSSTLYHALAYPRVKSVLRAIDHSSIYILIAGTYTPFTLVSIRGNWGWSLFGTVWGLALGGILFAGFFREQFPGVETLTYVLMGWLSVMVIHRLFATIGLTGLILLNWSELPYNHAIWHLFVLGGGTCHFLVVYFFVVPV